MERVPTGTLCTTFNLNLTPTVSRSGMMYVWPVVSPGERIGGGGVVHISDELCRAVSSEGPGDSEGATQAGTLQVGLPASLPVPPVPVRLAGTLRLARWQWPLLGTGTQWHGPGGVRDWQLSPLKQHAVRFRL